MYKLHLIFKYLLKRRIAWVSLVAVMLCTTMVLVVISVMGGWLNMLKSSFRGLSGDIVIHAETLRGFPYYQEIVKAIEEDPECKVEAAVPSIETYGLFNHGNGPSPVRVMAIPIAEMGRVNNFAKSLYLQHSDIEEQLKNPKLTPEKRQELQRKHDLPPSFDLLDEVSVPMDALPAGLKYVQPKEEQELPAGLIEILETFPKELHGKLRYDVLRHDLIFRGPMAPEWKGLLDTLSDDGNYKKAIDTLYDKSQSPDLVEYRRVRGKYHGMIVGVGVIGIRRNKEGVWQRPGTAEFSTPIGLTVLDLSADHLDTSSQVTRNYFIVDDSHIGTWQYDNSYIYVDFHVLQKDLGMDAQEVTIDDKPAIKPARATDIHIKVKQGIDANNEAELTAARDRIKFVIQQVFTEKDKAHGAFFMVSQPPTVETWQDTQRTYINAVENEKLLIVVLFAIISIVAIFLIFCIFYMIVVEKTKDIGIIKSVGAASGGVIAIFLGYGLAIGIVGSGMGFTLSYLIIHNINELHTWLGRISGIQIWNPEVYLFESIPNTMSNKDIAVILPIAVLSAVLGALVPAIRAGRMNPVEALRFE